MEIVILYLSVILYKFKEDKIFKLIIGSRYEVLIGVKNLFIMEIFRVKGN